MTGAHICALLSSAAAQCDGLPMLTCGSRKATARQVASRVAAFAVGLEQRLALKAGDCACVVALATDHNLEAVLAITAAGGIAAPLNWRWSTAEGSHAATLVDARLLLTDAACLGFAAKVAAGSSCVRALVLLGDPSSYAEADLGSVSVPIMFAEVLMAECPSPSLQLRFAPGGAALVLYTSGTTGKPKGVVLSHTALHVQSMAKLLVVGYSRSDTYLHAAPLFHIGGISSALAMLMAGARHVFLPRFAPTDFLATVETCGVTSFIAVPAMVAALVDAAGGTSGMGKYVSVRTILLGGGGTSPQLQAGVKALFPHASVHTAYGMTEAASSMTFHTLWRAPSGSALRATTAAMPSTSTPGQAGLAGPLLAAAAPESEMATISGSVAQPAERKPIAFHPPADRTKSRPTGSGGVFVGVPPPGIELAIYHPPPGGVTTTTTGTGTGQPTAYSSGRASSASVALGSAWGKVLAEGEGEVVTRGPHVMLGYWEDEAATQAAFLPGGWMRTGDLGHMCTGQLWLMGRAKDMIKSGGENVHAWEVERALVSHPAVAAAAVVGVSDWRLGEAVAAALVLRQGWEWRGARCQVLLQSARAQVVQVEAAAAAAAAGVSAAASSSAGVLLQAAAMEGPEAAGSAGRAGRGMAAMLGELSVGGDSYNADETAGSPFKLQAAGGWLGSPSLGSGGGLGGLPGISAALVEGSRSTRAPRGSPHQQQLQHAAAGLLQLSAQSMGCTAAGGGEGGSAGGGSAMASNWVDGAALQKHCRSAGLAGYKLPRVFFALPAGEALPANSTGKVLKHLVRERVGQEVRAAQAATGNVRAKL